MYFRYSLVEALVTVNRLSVRERLLPFKKKLLQGKHAQLDFELQLTNCSTLPKPLTF